MSSRSGNQFDVLSNESDMDTRPEGVVDTGKTDTKDPGMEVDLFEESTRDNDASKPSESADQQLPPAANLSLGSLATQQASEEASSSSTHPPTSRLPDSVYAKGINWHLYQMPIEQRRAEEARVAAQDATMTAIKHSTDSKKPYDMRDATPPVLRTSIHQVDRITPCMLQVSRVKDSLAMEPILGGINKAPLGYRLGMNLEAGRFGLPTLSVSGNFAKGKKDIVQPFVSSQPPPHSQVTWTWQPGVQCANGWMIDEFDYNQILSLPPGHSGRRVEVLAEYDEVPPKLYMVKFQSQGNTISGSAKFWKGFPPIVQSTLAAVSQPGSWITIWFAHRLPLNAVHTKWLEPFRTQVNLKIQPFSDYFDRDNKLIVDASKAAKIGDVGGGMLVISRFDPKTKMQPRTFHQYVGKIDFASPQEFQTVHSMSIVRNIQHQRLQNRRIRMQPHCVLIKASPELRAGDQGIVLDDMENQFYAYIRFSSDEKADRICSVPALHTLIDCYFVEDGKRKGACWSGMAISDPEGCEKTNTNMCALLTKGKSSKVGVCSKEVSDNELKATVVVREDFVTEHQELKAIETFVADTTAAYSAIREAFISRRLASHKPLPDLASRNQDLYDKFLDWAKSDVIGDNPEQISILETMRGNPHNYVYIDAPAGTGKTYVLALQIILAILLDLRILCIAQSNDAVDKMATEVGLMWDRVPKHLRTGHKMTPLRLDGQEELRAMMAIKGYQDIAKNSSKLLTRLTLESDPGVYRAVIEAFHITTQLALQADKFRDDGIPYFEAIARAHQSTSKTLHEYPAMMSAAARLYDMKVKDELRAQEDYTRAANIAALPKITSKQLARVMQIRPGFFTDEMQALALQDPIPEAEIANKIRSVQSRDRSFAFRQAQTDYIRKRGRLDRDERCTWEDLWMAQMYRVVGESNVIFTACSNTGSLLELGYHADIINCDQASQLSIPALCVAVTNSHWKAVFILGDREQLQPDKKAGRTDEFSYYGHMSASSLLYDKGCPSIKLKIQYRSRPEIVEFPSRFFYGQLLNAPSVHEDTAFKLAFCTMTRALFGMPLVYGIVDVTQGVSRVVQNRSLSNYAHASSITRAVEKLLRYGVPSGYITVLCYYEGQARLIIRQLQGLIPPAQFVEKGMKWDPAGVQVTTPDSYQGQENKYVFIDMVVASAESQSQSQSQSQRERPEAQEEAQEEAQDEAQDELSSFFQFGPPSFVRNPHRLCSALTRGEQGVLVFLNGNTINRRIEHRHRPTKVKVALNALYFDAYDRGCLIFDDKSEDTSPEGVAFRCQAPDEAGRILEDQIKTRGEYLQRYVQQGWRFESQ